MRRSFPRLAPPAEPGGAPALADDEHLQDALRAGRPWAEREVLERFTSHVHRVLVRILGSTAELDDLTQEVFLRALRQIGRLRGGIGLSPWLASFAVNVARETLRARWRRRWLVFFAPPDLPEPLDGRGVRGQLDADACADATRAVRATYEVLDDMGASARALFALRHIEGMELTELSSAFGVSLATIKRRVASAEKTFRARARRHEVLRDWIEEGDRCRRT